MKTLNFWRTLLFAVVATAAFTACSSGDDKEKPSTGDGPKITVNGGSSASVAVDLAGGPTSAVTVVSTGTWTMTIPVGSEWVKASATSGSKGSATVTFSPEANASERQATVTVSTTGKVPGTSVSIPVTASITIKQNDGGTTVVPTNVATVRQAVVSIATQDGAVITEDLTLTGIVISDIDNGGTGGDKSCYIVDNTTTAGAGIIVRFNSAYKFKKGDVISGSIKDGKATLYFGVLQVTPASDANFKATGENVTVEPISVAVADLVNYQSQLVKVTDVQPTVAARGQVYCPADAKNFTTTKFETKLGKELQISVYKTNKWAQTTTVPSNSGFMVGVVTINGGVGQVAPRNAGDVAGLTQPLFSIADLPSITGAPGSVSFVAAGETKTITFTAANLGTNKVYAKVTGADAASFPVAVGEKTSPISITVAANAGAAKAATLRIYAAASEGGAEVAGVNVALSQAAPGGSIGGGDTKGIYTSMTQFISNGDQYANPCGLGLALANGKEASGFKVGSSSKAGSFTSTAVSVTGAKKLGFYAVAWKGKTAKLYIKIDGGGSASVASVDLTANDGATGNPPFIALTPSDDINYYTVDLTGLTAASTISLSTAPTFDQAEDKAAGRAIVFGVQLF